MCVKPSFIWVSRGPGWEKMPKACGKCWRCRSNYVNDWVGRCLAEAQTVRATCCLTLTYAPRDDLADKVLTPSHFQDFIRSLRDGGTKVRYFVVGEYGEMKGRAHFHAILFLPERVPEIPHKKNWHLPQWPHGHVFADWAADERAIRYACKYLRKGDTRETWFSCSKKPELGHDWFQAKAREAVELGVMPSSFEYLPPGGHRNRPYLMTGATRRKYIAALVQGWRERRPLQLEQLSDWVRKAVEKGDLDVEAEWRRQVPLEQQAEAFSEAIDRERMREREGLSRALQTEYYVEHYDDTYEEMRARYGQKDEKRRGPRPRHA